MTSPSATNNIPAAIFDLDGVLTDTAELHYQSWLVIAGQLGLTFDRARNEALRGIGRMQSLDLMLGDHASDFTAEQKVDLAARKNDEYIRLVGEMTPKDLFPGARELLESLRASGVVTALASSSKNGGRVVDQLRIRSLLDVIVDGNDAPKSKPDPQVFLLAAQRLCKPPDRCVVVEDAEAGVEAALRAGMRVIGIGPAERVGRAAMFVAEVGTLRVEDFLKLVPAT